LGHLALKLFAHEHLDVPIIGITFQGDVHCAFAACLFHLDTTRDKAIAPALWFRLAEHPDTVRVNTTLVIFADPVVVVLYRVAGCMEKGVVSDGSPVCDQLSEVCRRLFGGLSGCVCFIVGAIGRLVERI